MNWIEFLWHPCACLFQVPRYSVLLNCESANTKIKREETGDRGGGSHFLFPFSLPANFSRTFFFRVFPTIWEPGTGYPCANPQLIVVLSFGRWALDLAHTVFSICTFSIIHLVCLPHPPTPTKKIAWPLLVLQSPQEMRKTMPVVYYGRRANGEYRAYSHDVCCCPETKNDHVGVANQSCRSWTFFLLFNKFA